MSDLRGLRQRILEVAYAAGEGHVASAFSILEIVWALYDHVLQPVDRFVLSKGHGCLALYAVLEATGRLPAGTFDTFGSKGGLEGHPNRLQYPAIEATTGSLGHGLPIAVGMALGKKIADEPGRIYVLCGDQEMSEGSCWEAAATASHRKLDNLILIVDRNGSDHRSLPMTSLSDKLRAFGFAVVVRDGHQNGAVDPMRLVQVGKPIGLIANTVKGRGSPTMEHDPEAWHHRAPKDLAELGILVGSLR